MITSFFKTKASSAELTSDETPQPSTPAGSGAAALALNPERPAGEPLVAVPVELAAALTPHQAESCRFLFRALTGGTAALRAGHHGHGALVLATSASSSGGNAYTEAPATGLPLEVLAVAHALLTHPRLVRPAAAAAATNVSATSGAAAELASAGSRSSSSSRGAAAAVAAPLAAGSTGGVASAGSAASTGSAASSGGTLARPPLPPRPVRTALVLCPGGAATAHAWGLACRRALPGDALPVLVLDRGTTGSSSNNSKGGHERVPPPSAAARVQLLAAWQRHGGILLCG